MTDYPIIFRMERVDGENHMGEAWLPIAFFPHEHVNYGKLGCYAHLGQHGEADLGYYQSTRKPRAADSAKVAELERELRQIYETGDDAVKLAVKQRLPHDWRTHAWKR